MREDGDRRVGGDRVEGEVEVAVRSEVLQQEHGRHDAQQHHDPAQDPDAQTQGLVYGTRIGGAEQLGRGLDVVVDLVTQVAHTLLCRPAVPEGMPGSPPGRHATGPRLDRQGKA